MKSIQQLIPDIYNYVGGDNGLSDLLASNMGTDIASAVQRSLSPQELRGLRLSGMGPKCPRALWYSINSPELAEPLPPYARIKYTYGHIIEHLVIGLAKAAGHEVTGEQDELSVDGITGHRDCIIDGAIVDVKSSSSRGFQKFKDKTIAQSDDFGYLDQLDGYILGSADDDLVRVKDRAYLLAIDKTLGHMCLYEHRFTSLRDNGIHNRIRQCKEIVGLSSPPSCTCKSIPDGKSGNYKLDVKASYSPYKFHCHPQLRTFLYSSGPVYLTKVVRVPDVVELTKHYH